MTDYKYDLAIAYRIYPGLSKNVMMPDAWRDKLHFSEVCLKSFVRGLTGVKYKIFALLDGCDESYEDLFRSNCENVEIIKYQPSIGNKGTFAAQIDILLKQTDAAAVYFAEDDYFYHDGALSEMLGMLEHGDVDFITPYDHPDCFTRKDLHNYKSEVVFQGKRHWRTAASTCLTFMTTRDILAVTSGCFRSYCRISDFALWLAVTKLKRFDAPYKTLKRMYKHNFIHMITARPFKLWAPMPSLANHMAAAQSAPGADWEKLIRRYV
jgi:hypothetical protein